MLSSVNLTPPYIEFAYRSANLSVLEIQGYNQVTQGKWFSLVYMVMNLNVP
jgi:hypothetical protein